MVAVIRETVLDGEPASEVDTAEVLGQGVMSGIPIRTTALVFEAYGMPPTLENTDTEEDAKVAFMMVAPDPDDPEDPSY